MTAMQFAWTCWAFHRQWRGGLAAEEKGLKDVCKDEEGRRLYYDESDGWFLDTALDVPPKGWVS